MYQLRRLMSKIRINNIYKTAYKTYKRKKGRYKRARKAEGDKSVNRLKNLLKAN